MDLTLNFNDHFTNIVIRVITRRTSRYANVKFRHRPFAREQETLRRVCQCL